MAGGEIMSDTRSDYKMVEKTGHILFFGFGFCAAALAPLADVEVCA